MEKIYALYCDDRFVMAKPFSIVPLSAYDFGLAQLPTSEYAVCEIGIVNRVTVAVEEATIPVS